MSTEKCYCGANKSFQNCCEKYLIQKSKPPTAEALMRSRYSAFVTKSVGYLLATQDPESPVAANEESLFASFQNTEWIGLKVISAKQGQPGDKKGTVEFIAYFSQGGVKYEHHEVSEFRKDPKQNMWLYVRPR
jgi:SEC-C motif-containing protein